MRFGVAEIEGGNLCEIPLIIATIFNYCSIADIAIYSKSILSEPPKLYDFGLYKLAKYYMFMTKLSLTSLISQLTPVYE